MNKTPALNNDNADDTQKPKRRQWATVLGLGLAVGGTSGFFLGHGIQESDLEVKRDTITKLQSALKKPQLELAELAEQNGFSVSKGLLSPEFKQVLRATEIYNPKDTSIFAVVKNEKDGVKIIILPQGNKIRYIIDDEKSNIESSPVFYKSILKAVGNDSFYEAFKPQPVKEIAPPKATSAPQITATAQVTPNP